MYCEKWKCDDEVYSATKRLIFYEMELKKTEDVLRDIVKVSPICCQSVEK
jgi:hypothetical protein